jgi:hypothetical protein
MYLALKSRKKDPKWEICLWNKLVRNRPTIFASQPGFEPTAANPVVFHLHGRCDVTESLVLTEDDYLDFLANLSRGQDVASNEKNLLLPARIQHALNGASLLFIGYSLQDWTFRVLFRNLVMTTEAALRRISVTIQLPPPTATDQIHLKNGDVISGKIVQETKSRISIDTQALGSLSVDRKLVVRVAPGSHTGQKAITEYLDKYFEKTDMRVYWGTAQEFSKELRDRCVKGGIIT